MKREKSTSTQSKQLFPIRRSQSSQRPSILQRFRDGLQSKRSLARLSDRNKYDVQYRLPQENVNCNLLKGFWPSCSENAFELNGSKGGSKSKKTTTFIPPEYMTLANEPSLLPKFLREKLKLKSRNTTRNFFGQGALVLSPITIKKEDDMSLMDSKPNFAFSLNTNKNEAVYRASGDHQKQASTPLQSQSPEPMRCQGQHYDISPLSKPNLTTRTSISPHLHTNLTSQNKSKKDNVEDQLLRNFNSHRTNNEDQTINSVLTYKKNSESSFSANFLGSIKLKRTPSHVSYKTIDLRSVGVEAEKNQDLSPSKRCKESIEFRRKRWTSMLRVRNPEFARIHGQTSSPYESGQATSRKEEKLIS